MHAVVAAPIDAHVIGDLVGRADGARGLGLLEFRAFMRVGEGDGLIAAIAGPGAVRDAHGAVPEAQRVGGDRLVRVVLDGAAHLLLLDAQAGIEHPLIDAPVIRGEQRDIAPRVVVDQGEGRGAGEAVRGDHGAVAQGEVDEAGVRRRRHQLVVAEIPGVIRMVYGEVTADGELVAGHDIEGEAQIVGERLQLLVHDPIAVGHHVLIRIDRAAAVHIRRSAAGRRLDARPGKGGVCRRDRACDEGGHGFGRCRTREDAGGRHVAPGELRLVRQVHAIRDVEVEIAAEGVQVRAAPIGEIRGQRRAPGTLLHGQTLDPGAGVPAGHRVEAGKRRVRHALAGAGRDQGNVRDEQVLVVQLAEIKHHLALIEGVREGRGDLSAVIGGELRFSNAVRFAIEAADAEEPVLGQRTAVEAVDPVHALRAVGDTEIAVLDLGALPEYEVGGETHLPVGVEYARAAQDHFRTLDRVVEPEHGGVVQERQVMRRIDRRAVDRVSHIRCAAAPRITREFDVGPGLAPARLRPHARHDLEQIRGARRIHVVDFLEARGGHLKARIEFSGRLRRRRHHHLVQGVGIRGARFGRGPRSGGRLSCRILRPRVTAGEHRTGESEEPRDARKQSSMSHFAVPLALTVAAVRVTCRPCVVGRRLVGASSIARRTDGDRGRTHLIEGQPGAVQQSLQPIDDREVTVDCGGLMPGHKSRREHQCDVGLPCKLIESRCGRLRLDVEMPHCTVGVRLRADQRQRQTANHPSRAHDTPPGPPRHRRAAIQDELCKD